MDMIEKLYNMIKESEERLPFKPNTVRKDLDFHAMPHTAYNNPTNFVLNCINGREEFICDMFNLYYASMNSKRYPLEPRVFLPTEFSIRRNVLDSAKELIYITLPDEFAESLEFCRAYVLTYTRNDNQINNFKFFTIEDSMYGWKNLGYITETGVHKRFAHPTGCMDDHLRIICQTAFPDE